MKVIITGATGLVGRALLRKCIADERITHIYVVTRSALHQGATENAEDKVTVIEHNDFATYPAELMEKLAGAEACLWAIGGKATQFPDLETAKKVQVEYTLAAANAFLNQLAPLVPDNRPFRFVFCSGKFAEWNQTKSLLFMKDTRRLKGEVEKGLCDLADANKDHFEVFCVRPSGILPSNAGSAEKFASKLFAAIDVNKLAQAMVDIALNGYPKRIIENNVLLKM